AVKKLQALLFPAPHQGHLTPAVNLALKLASEGFSITFVVFEYLHRKLSAIHKQGTSEFDLFSEAHNKSGLKIDYTTIADGLPDDFDREARLVEFYEYLMNEFQPLVDEFVGEKIRSDPDTTYFIVSDTILLWQAAAAEKYNLLHVSFWTQPSMVYSLGWHSELLREHGHYPLKDNIEEDVDYVPGIQSVNTRDFMPYLRPSHPFYDLGARAFDLSKKADFVLHNTVQELESSILSALNKYKPNYAIGLTNTYGDLVKIPTKKSLWAESDCTRWLESKAPSSVLYISFGSMVLASDQVIEEIVHGVILSQVNFIWVTRHGDKGSPLNIILPAAFDDEFKDRGLIVPWCDQIKVLSSPSVGAFLTHCGWNSVMESIWCGIPMLCYPVEADQPTNKKLVVDDWKVGL
ncbi:hypothetical protein M569_14447, partial [Genlisea aurea]